MTEITRVPLLPIAKGSKTRLWLGVLAACLGGAALAYAGNPPQVAVQTIVQGSGNSPVGDDFVLINYEGRLANGVVFDSAQHAVFPMQRMVPGFTRALEQMQAGGKYVVNIPAALAYGDKATGPIPANSDLTFTVELLDFKTAADIEAKEREMQARAAAGAGDPAAAANPAADPAAPR